MSISWCIATAVAACLVWAGDAEAQRQQGTPQRQGTVNRAALPRPQMLPDLRCSVAVTTDKEGHNPIPNGSRHQWSAAFQPEFYGPFPTGDFRFVRPSFWVWANVINAGPGEANVMPGISIRLNGNALPMPSAAAIALAPHSSKMHGPYQVGPLDEGVYTIAARVITDVGNFQAESNEGNNICEWQVVIDPNYHAEAKLELTSVFVNPSNMKATVRVRNAGASASEEFRVWATIRELVERGMSQSAYDRYDCDGIEMTGPALSPGLEVEVSKAFPLLPGVVDPRCIPGIGEFTVEFRLNETHGGYSTGMWGDSDVYTVTRMF